MKTTPPAVIGPPRLGEPHVACACFATSGLNKAFADPSGTSHVRLPFFRSIATSVPKGGGVQGRPDGAISMRRRMT